MAQARTWTVEADETGAVDPEEVQNALCECAVLLLRAGGTTSQVAMREPMPPEAKLPGVFYTWRVVITWLSRTDTAPQLEQSDTRRQDVGEPEFEPELEPDPEAESEPVAA